MVPQTASMMDFITDFAVDWLFIPLDEFPSMGGGGEATGIILKLSCIFRPLRDIFLRQTL